LLKLLKNIAFVFLFILNQQVCSQNFYVKIIGPELLETKTIDSIGYTNKHSSVKSVVEEINLFSDKLLKIGYLENFSDAPKKENDSTYMFSYHLGEKTKYMYINIDSSLEIIGYKKGEQKILIADVSFWMNTILQKLEKKGFSLASLQLVNFRNENNQLIAVLKTNIETKRVLNDIVVNGYEKFPVGFKKNLLRPYKNKVFNQDNLTKIASDLDKIRFVTQIKSPEILFSKDSTKVFVYLEKSKPNLFDGYIGFASNEDKKVVFTGYVDLQLQNILNSGEKFSIYWKSDGKNQKAFTGSVEFPYVLQTPIGIKGQLAIFKQDSIYQNTQTNLDLGYHLRSNSKIYLGFQNTESSDIQNTNTTSISDYKNSFLTSHFDYTQYNVQDYLFPEKTKIYFKIGFGKRNSNTNSNQQFISELNVSHLLHLNKKNSIQIKSLNYYLKSNQYIINELYRFGGINSIRGFNENSLQANFFSSLLSEYRYLIASNLYVHSVIDYGYFQDKSTKINSSLVGVGLGFGLLTKNGLFNLVYTNGSTREQAIKLSNSIVHISFKAKF